MPKTAMTVKPVPAGPLADGERLWRPADVAAYLCEEFTVKTLANWRTAKIGPPFVMIRNRPFYRPGTVRAWAAGHERSTTPAGEVA